MVTAVTSTSCVIVFFSCFNIEKRCPKENKQF